MHACIVDPQSKMAYFKKKKKNREVNLHCGESSHIASGRDKTYSVVEYGVLSLLNYRGCIVRSNCL
jgi:hypothetical protein